MTEQIINIDIYRRSVVILQGTESELEDWFIEHDEKLLLSTILQTDWDNTLAITFDDDSDVYICSVNPMKQNTLCHELSHATLKILRIVGIDPIEAEEAYAYLFEYLFSQATSSQSSGSLSQSCEDESRHIPL